MLLMVGPGLQAELGWTLFATLYAAAGAAANLSAYVGNVLIRRRRLWETKGASAPVYALLACTALVQPYRRFVWLFGLQLNSLGCGSGNTAAGHTLLKWLGVRNCTRKWHRVSGAGSGIFLLVSNEDQTSYLLSRSSVRLKRSFISREGSCKRRTQALQPGEDESSSTRSWTAVRVPAA